MSSSNQIKELLRFTINVNGLSPVESAKRIVSFLGLSCSDIGMIDTDSLYSVFIVSGVSIRLDHEPKTNPRKYVDLSMSNAKCGIFVSVGIDEDGKIDPSKLKHCFNMVRNQ